MYFNICHFLENKKHSQKEKTFKNVFFRKIIKKRKKCFYIYAYNSELPLS